MEYQSKIDPTRQTAGKIYRDAQINGEKGVIIGDVNHEIQKDLVKDINEAIEQGEKAVTSPMAFDKRPIAQAFQLTDAMKKDLYREMHGYAAMASSVPEMT